MSHRVIAHCVICDIEKAKLSPTEAYAVGYTHAAIAIKTNQRAAYCPQHSDGSVKETAGNGAQQKLAAVYAAEKRS